MTLEPATTCGQWKETSCIVITSNVEFISVCRREEHSQPHWSTLTWPGLRTQIWMYCKKNVSTIIGTAMWIELCRIHRQDSRCLRFWMKNLLKDICGPGEGTYKDSSNNQTRLCVAWNFVRNVKSSWEEGKAGMDDWKTKAWQRSKTERHLLHRSGRWRVSGNHKKKNQKKLEVPMETVMPCKLETKKNSKRLWETASKTTEIQQSPQDNANMHRGSSWIHRESVWNPLFQEVMKITPPRNGSIR